jgi:DNA-binding MarR family transcriptional regulator
MTDETPWYATISMPALLRHARMTYGVAMRRALEAGGYEDIPANGLYIIGGLALREGESGLGQLIKELRVSKQVAGQLVDTLVTRGYLDRTVDPEDRRRLKVTLTERGRAAAATQAAARAELDAELAERIGAEEVLRVRRALVALVAMGNDPEI